MGVGVMGIQGRKIREDEEMVQLLGKLINIDRRDVIITGGTGSGKTTFLNALEQHIKHNIIKTTEDHRRSFDDIQEEMTMAKLAGIESILVIDGLPVCKELFKQLVQEIKINRQIQNYIVTGHTEMVTRMYREELRQNGIHTREPIVIDIKRLMDPRRYYTITIKDRGEVLMEKNL